MFLLDPRNPRKVRNNAANPCETTRCDTRKTPLPRSGHQRPKTPNPIQSNALCRIEPVRPQPAGGLGRRTIRVDPVSGRRLCDVTPCQAKACREKPPIQLAPFSRRDEKPPPTEPRPGWHALSVNKIRSRTRRYEYFLRFQPVAMAGYSIYIYHVTRDEANRVRRELGLPELPAPQPRLEDLLGTSQRTSVSPTSRAT